MGLHFLCVFVVFLPSGSDCLPLGEELDCSLSVEVAGSPHTVLVSSEGEHREGHGDGEINSDLAAFNFMLELSGSVSTSGEDGSSISVLACVDQVDTFLESVSSDDAEDGSEDLIIVGGSAWLAVVDDGGSDEVSLLESLYFNASSIEDDFVLFGSFLDDCFNSGLGLEGDEGRDIDILSAWSHCQLLALLHYLGDPLLTVSNHNSN
jgi:hypothetical protein